MASDQPNDAAAVLAAAKTVPGLLSTTARVLVASLNASACTISRAIGDLLVDLVDYSPTGSVQLGHGYLISDYPATREVLEELRPNAVSVADPSADEHEVALLRQLGFESLLMLPLAVNGAAWGLVEVYNRDRDRFSQRDLEAASDIVAHASAALTRLAG